MKIQLLIQLILVLDKLDLMLNIFGGWFHNLDIAQQIFLGIAIICSILFLIQLLIDLLDRDLENDAVKHPSFLPAKTQSPIFKSSSLSTFFTFFGWMGFLNLTADGSMSHTLILATTIGLFALLLSIYLPFIFSKRKSQKLQLDEKILFQFGTARSCIPANRTGFGKVKIMNGKTKSKVRAVTEGDEIRPGQKVRVIGILTEKTLLVEVDNA